MGLFGNDSGSDSGSTEEVARLRTEVARLEQRVSALERALQGLAAPPSSPARHARPSPPDAPMTGTPSGAAAPTPAAPGAAPAVPDEVVRLAGEGKTIEAIKAMRAHTGLGLAEAKRIVDGL